MRYFKSMLALMLAVCMVFSNTAFSALAAGNDSVMNAPEDGTTTGIPFVKGTAGSNSYRIPAMVTLSDGTLVAAADTRWNTTYDGGGADTMAARSTDNGATWDYTFANYLGDNGNQYNGKLSTDFIDPSLAVTKDDTIYMLVDLYPYGVALNGDKDTTPATATGFNTDGTLKLSKNGSGYTYYLKNGNIYNSRNVAESDYTVDEYFNIYNNGTYVSNLFFVDSPYKVVRTGYLYLTSSKDGGASWSAPTLIPNVKTDKEQVCLIGPGNGLVLNDGTIVFAVYSYNGSQESQKTGFIYSTDNGASWTRSDSSISWSSEASIVELNESTLRVFYRNGSSRICYADVTKNGDNYTWGNPVTTDVACNSNTQLSAIKVTGNDTDYILISNPGNESNQSGASYRTNGQIVTFKASDMTVVKKTSVPSVHTSNSFMYSSMSQLQNSDIAILYEDQESGWGTGDNYYYQMSFKTYTLSELGIETQSTEEPVDPEETEEEQQTEISPITVSETISMTTGKSLTLAPDVPEGGSVTYRIANGGNLISLNGAKVTAGNTTGTATVVAEVTAANGNAYATYTYTIKVAEIENKDAELTLDQNADTEISVTLNDGQTVEWSSADASIAGVGKAYSGETATDKAIVVANNAGSTTITARVKNADGAVAAIYNWATTVNAIADTNTSSRYIYINVTQIENCTVYYAINGGELIRLEGTGVLLDKQMEGHFNIMFFADPDDGYALTYMCVTGSAKQYYVLSNGNPDGTGSDAWPFVSDTQTTIPTSSGDASWKSGHGFRWSLLEGNMTINRMKAMFAQAIALGCDGVTNFTKNAANSFYTEVQFVAQPMATLTKEIASITDSTGKTTAYKEGSKINLGDTINYTVTVTRPAYTTGKVWDGSTSSFSSTSPITTSNTPAYIDGNYGTITYSNVQLNDEMTANSGISNPALDTSGATAKTFTYNTSLKVTMSNYAEVVKNGIITNTADLTYDYQSQYSTGKTAAKADAKAEVEVDVPEYVIDFGLPVEISLADILGNTSITSGTASYGRISANGTSFTYTPSKTLKGRDSIVLKLSNGDSYGVNIYPATSVYYEEGFADADGFTGGTKGSGTQATQAAGHSSDNYGYDNAYASNAANSSNTSYTSSESGSKLNMNFTGTGIDIYANCSADTGKVNVYIYKVGEDDALTIEKLAIVDTSSNSAIYGISDNQEYDLPIVSVNGLEYGNYLVKIVAKGVVDIDGFRVYETMEQEPSFYVNDMEDQPVLVELRNQVLTTATADVDTAVEGSESSDQSYKQVFEDLSGDDTITSAILNTNSAISSSDLLEHGPKNELFLAPGQAVVFTLSTDRKVEVGLKTVNGATTYTITNETADGIGVMASDKAISSTTDMFYTAANNRTDGECSQTISIANTGSNYLSVTKVKVCDDPKAGFSALNEDAIKTAYAALKKITLTVNPKTTSLVSVKNTTGRKMIVKWKKNSAVTGYQLQYSTSKYFKSGTKTISFAKNSTVSKTLTSLKKGKTYYVHIRTYKKVGTKKFYSKWSLKKSVKIVR